MQTKTTLGLEQLDRRDMPSITMVGGVLTITGLDDPGGRDVATVSILNGKVRATLTSYGPTGPMGTLVLGQTLSKPIGSVNQVVFHGLAGDDKFTNNTAIPCIANGGVGKDKLFGGGGKDLLRGGANDDYLSGRGGNDTLKGAGGKDELHGGAHHDTLYGGTEDDKLYGETGHDKLYGGAGNDLLYGFTGLDALYGEGGSDYLDGGQDGTADLLEGGNPEGDTFKSEPSAAGNLDEPTDATDPGDIVI